MYSLVSHIAVEGASVTRYKMNTASAVSVAARYDGRYSGAALSLVDGAAASGATPPRAGRREGCVRSARLRDAAMCSVRAASDSHDGGRPITVRTRRPWGRWVRHPLRVVDHACVAMPTGREGDGHRPDARGLRRHERRVAHVPV